MTRDKEKKVGKEQQLLDAARLGQVEQLEAILSQYMQLKSKKRTNPLASLRKCIGPNSTCDPVTGFTCLHHAALNGHAKCVQLIVECGAKLNAVDYKGSTALHLAAWAGNLQIVKILLSYSLGRAPAAGIEANIDRSTTSGGGDGSDEDIRQMLFGPPFSSGGVKQTKPGPLSSSSPPTGHHRQMNDETRRASCFLYQAIDINLRNNDNQTALSLAAQFGHNEVVCELLANSANVNLRNNQLESPLDLACLNGRLETVRLLLNSTPTLVDELSKSHSTILISLSPKYRNFGQDVAPIKSQSELGHSQTQSSHLPPKTCSNAEGHPRQSSIVSGWSSLLRGTGASKATSKTAADRLSPASTSSDHNQSQRRASLALTDQRQHATTTGPATIVDARTTLQQRFIYAQNQQCSLDSSLSPTSSGCKHSKGSPGTQESTTTSGAQSSSFSERLLDHSPLHLAVRRGHLNVIQLLLNEYNANLMQLTSFGSVLHEMALNYGGPSETMLTMMMMTLPSSRLQATTTTTNSDILNTFVAHLSKKASGNYVETKLNWNKLLSIKNGQNKTVFDLLNEKNTRSAQEIKRFIYETNEQLDMMCAAAAAAATSRNDENNKWQQQQQPQYFQRHQVFCNQQQINSFVTMKRAPKHQQQQQQHKQASVSDEPAALANQFNNLNTFKQQQHYPYRPLMNDGTQTIDRRAPATSMMPSSSNNAGLFDFSQACAAFGPDCGNFNSSFANGRPAFVSNQVQSTFYATKPLTRSVSNLMHRAAPPLGQRPISGEMQAGAEPPPISWHHQEMITTSGDSADILSSRRTKGISISPEQLKSMQQQIDEQQKQHEQQYARQSRSKSRDLGSLLMEMSQQREQIAAAPSAAAPASGSGSGEDRASALMSANASSSQQEQLYDNQILSTSFNSTATRDEQNGYVSGTAYSRHQNHQLVRSQTDCSHLMGKLLNLGQQTTTTTCGADLTTKKRLLNATLMSTTTTSGQQQQQQQHAPVVPFVAVGQQRSENSSLTSVNANSSNNNSSAGSYFVNQLVPTKLLTQQHSATLDRRAINRHYHVYDHEFYPPRLVSSNTQQQHLPNLPNHHNLHHHHHQQQQQYQAVATSFDDSIARHKQASIAIVPPLDRRDNDDDDNNNVHQQHDRLTSVSQSSLNNFNNGSLASVADSTTMDHGHDAGATNQQVVAARQQEQMNRFVCRHSRKSATSANGELTSQSFASSNDSRGQQQQQQQQVPLVISNMHASQSLESHLGSEQFESTRKALMRDFDQMLGSELLNCRDGQQQVQQQLLQGAANSIGGSGSGTSSQNSILTGVSLDMDTSGERLIVSGTRITMPADQQQQQQQQLVEQDTISCDSSLYRAKRRISPRVSSDGANQCGAQAAPEVATRVAPQKPPRPSLRSQQKFKSLQLSSTNGGLLQQQNRSPARQASQQQQQLALNNQAIIYDLPVSSVGSLDSNSNSNSFQHHRPASQTSTNSVMLTPSSQAAPAHASITTPAFPKLARHTQAGGATSTSSQVSLSMTEAPSVRPPPPPIEAHHRAFNSDCASSLLMSPLNVHIAPGAIQCAGGGGGGSSARSLAGLLAQAPVSHDDRNNQRQRSTKHQPQQQQDVDSGVCTSNSPTSLSHDSDATSSNETVAPEFSKQQQNSSDSDRNKSLGSSSGVGDVNINVNVWPISPPSPRTAQMSIEEMLMPLDESGIITQEVANQTSSLTEIHDDDDCKSSRISAESQLSKRASLSAQVELIFGWLGGNQNNQNNNNDNNNSCATTSQDDHEHARSSRYDESGNGADHYENCLDLQRKLQGSSCRSIGNLFGSLQLSSMSVPDEATLSSSSSSPLVSSQYDQCNQENDDDDDDDDDVTERDLIETSDANESSWAHSNESANRVLATEGNKSVQVSSSLSLSSSSCSLIARQNDNLPTQACKEVTLKVVVDENELKTSGDEVFYINPLELKKISNIGKKVGTAEAETLTDEELCASVDKNSGFIRFTLKKRHFNLESDDNRSDLVSSSNHELKQNTTSTKDRNSDNDDADHADQMGIDINSDDVIESVSSESEHCLRHVSSAKRTKLNDDDDCDGDDASTKGSHGDDDDKKKKKKSDIVCETSQISTNVNSQIIAPARTSLDDSNIERIEDVVQQEKVEEQVEEKEEKADAEAEEEVKIDGSEAQSGTQAPSARKASADSVQMDTSQASTSSSELSIKSIVSLKGQQQQQPVLVVADSVGSRDENSVNNADLSVQKIAAKLPEASADLANAGDINGALPTDRQVAPKASIGSVKSIVSETARKLESAAAAANNTGSSLKRPIAAARRTLQHGPKPQVANCLDKQNVTANTDRKLNTIEQSKIEKINVGDSSSSNNNNNNKENLIEKINPIGQAPLRKSSICWPPKQVTGASNQVGEQQKRAPDCNDELLNEKNPPQAPASVDVVAIAKPIVGRVTANRLSFQKMIEETNKSNSASLTRPKPPPPVKPVGLVLAASNRLKTKI